MNKKMESTTGLKSNKEDTCMKKNPNTPNYLTEF